MHIHTNCFWICIDIEALRCAHVRCNLGYKHMRGVKLTYIQAILRRICMQIIVQPICVRIHKKCMHFCAAPLARFSGHI
jgi:hypothetical protein